MRDTTLASVVKREFDFRKHEFDFRKHEFVFRSRHCWGSAGPGGARTGVFVCCNARMPYHDPIDTRNESRERRRQEAVDDRERAADREGWEFFMSDARGRRLIGRVVRVCGVFDSSYTGNSDTYFREGRRDIGLFILSQLRQHVPEHYAGAVMERQEDERSNELDG